MMPNSDFEKQVIADLSEIKVKLTNYQATLHDHETRMRSQEKLTNRMVSYALGAASIVSLIFSFITDWIKSHA